MGRGVYMATSNLRVLKIKSIYSDMLIQDIAKIFKDEDIKHIVVYKNDIIKGIISEKEMIEAYFNGKSLSESIEGIINDNFYTVESTCPIKNITKVIEDKPNTNIVMMDNKKEALGIITKDVILEYFYNEMKTKIYNITKEKKDIKRKLNIIEIINNLEELYLWNKELEQIFENSPNAFVIQDEIGNTLRVNKEFENITGLKRENIIGRNVKGLEEEGVYNPAVGLLVLKEKRRISVIQKLKNGKEALVTGVPVYDEKGNIFRVVLNSLDYKELDTIHKYYSKQKEDYVKPKPDNDTNFTYESDSMKKIFELINQLKNVDSTILMTGESGVGKGVIARYIHRNGIRKKGRMVEINCGAIPETLLESELLGYEGGAFTGAQKGGKPGLIELANKGTLFLDEIGEMPMKLQVKLLQVIQERKIIRVGGVNPIDVDVRIIAATNKDLQDMVNKEKFRLDLFYRLNVIPINIPALRERKSDIIPMSKYFLEKYNKKYNKDVVIGETILDTMLSYEWPGNVRELENAMERLVVTNPSCVIEKENNKCEVFDLNTENDLYETLNFLDDIFSLDDAKMELEKKIVKMAYEKYKSSYKVAKALKISQSSASRKIREYI